MTWTAWVDGTWSSSWWTFEWEVRCLQLWGNIVGACDVATTMEQLKSSSGLCLFCLNHIFDLIKLLLLYWVDGELKGLWRLFWGFVVRGGGERLHKTLNSICSTWFVVQQSWVHKCHNSILKIKVSWLDCLRLFPSSKSLLI